MRTILLELMRHGTDHNQLLSPSLPYLAVCENAPVTTIQQPFEHRELLVRLSSLSYPEGNKKYVEAQRSFQLQDIGRALGRMLSDIPGLTSALGVARQDGDGDNAENYRRPFLNLRLVLSAKELALLPFETTISGAGFPGTSEHLLLQLSMPFSITRESRRSARRHYLSPLTPKVLFAYCDLPGAPVPSRAHALALRAAFDPWLRAGASIHEHLHVLRNASLRELTQQCREHRYTHVHLLAHGAPQDSDTVQSLNVIALRSDSGDEPFERVTGRNLARALSPMKGQEDLNQPLVVTLATCDSGRPQGVPLDSGGDSLAHALHAAGVPLVVASQFPLTYEGSVVMAGRLYEHLLYARDPRVAMIDVRHELVRRLPWSQDWASLVCYLSLHPEFDARNPAAELKRLSHAVIRGDLDGKDAESQFDSSIEDRYRDALQRIESYAPATPLSADDNSDHELMRAGVHRRYGLWLARLGKSQESDLQFDKAKALYLNVYRQRPQRFWTLTEALRLSLVLATGRNAPDRDVWPSATDQTLAGLVGAKQAEKAATLTTRAPVAASSPLDAHDTFAEGLPLPAADTWWLLHHTARFQLKTRTDDRAWMLVDAIEVDLLAVAAGQRAQRQSVLRMGRELAHFQGADSARRTLLQQLKRYRQKPFAAVVDGAILDELEAMLSPRTDAFARPGTNDVPDAEFKAMAKKPPGRSRKAPT